MLPHGRRTDGWTDEHVQVGWERERERVRELQPQPKRGSADGRKEEREKKGRYATYDASSRRVPQIIPGAAL